MAADLSKSILPVYIFILSLLASLFLGTYFNPISGLFTNQVIRRYSCDGSHYHGMVYETPIKSQTSKTNRNLQRQRLYIGVMSTKANLFSRVNALVDTWGHHPEVRLEIFANTKNSTETNGTFTVLHNGARVVTLPGVPDVSYPPQKKSFAMLKYIHDNHLNGFDWFMRADDDAYVKIEKILLFLSKIDPGQPHFIGQPGYGKHQEDYLFGNNYCMGGTGVLLSRELLRQLGPRLSTCMRQLYTEHEDIELGRCVRTVTNVGCTTAWETSTLFHQHYGGESGQRDNIERMIERKRVDALTFHANKDPKYQYSFHLSILSDQIKELLLRISKLEANTEATSPQILIKRSDEADSCNVWSAITNQQIFSATVTALVRRIPSVMTEALSETAFYGVTFELQRRDGVLPAQINQVAVRNARYRATSLESEDIIGDFEVQFNNQETKYEKNVHLRRSFPKSLIFFNEPYDLALDRDRAVNANVFLSSKK